jgi:hypothetical protein
MKYHTVGLTMMSLKGAKNEENMDWRGGSLFLSQIAQRKIDGH